MVEKKPKSDKTPVYISHEGRALLKEIVSKYQENSQLRVTQQYVLEKLLNEEKKKLNL